MVPKTKVHRFNKGIFEIYPSTGGGEHWKHHTHMVPHGDCREATVEETIGGKYKVTTANQEKPTWTKLIKPTMVNSTLSQRNKHHPSKHHTRTKLTPSPPSPPYKKISGFNDMSVKAMKRETVEESNASPEMIEWFKSFK